MSKEAIKPVLSLKEKKRRWSLLQEKLKSDGLSALLVYGGSQLGVPVHYLANIWGNRMNMVIFPAEGEPILLIPSNSGQTPTSVIAQGCWIKEENIHLASHLALDTAKQIINLKMQKSRIGLSDLSGVVSSCQARRSPPIFRRNTGAQEFRGAGDDG
jgi:hypothetical protein